MCWEEQVLCRGSKPDRGQVIQQPRLLQGTTCGTLTAQCETGACSVHGTQGFNAAAASNGHKATHLTSASVLPFSTVMPALVDSTSPGLYNHTATRRRQCRTSANHTASHCLVLEHVQPLPVVAWTVEHQPCRKESNRPTTTTVNDE